MTRPDGQSDVEFVQWALGGIDLSLLLAEPTGPPDGPRRRVRPQLSPLPDGNAGGWMHNSWRPIGNDAPRDKRYKKGELLLGTEEFKLRFATGERQVRTVIVSSPRHPLRWAALAEGRLRGTLDRFEPETRERLKRPLKVLARRVPGAGR